jgi:hypothetical protein
MSINFPLTVTVEPGDQGSFVRGEGDGIRCEGWPNCSLLTSNRYGPSGPPGVVNDCDRAGDNQRTPAGIYFCLLCILPLLMWPAKHLRASLTFVIVRGSQRKQTPSKAAFEQSSFIFVLFLLSPKLQ